MREFSSRPDAKARRNARDRERRKHLRESGVSTITEKQREAKRTCMRKYFSENIQANLGNRLRRRLHKFIGGGNSVSMRELLGCSYSELIIYLEQKFVDGMSWDNRGEWHIDHIIPCCHFDLTKEDDQRACFHYTNLQPLWSSENCSKGGRIVNLHE